MRPSKGSLRSRWIVIVTQGKIYSFFGNITCVIFVTINNDYMRPSKGSLRSFLYILFGMITCVAIRN